MSSQGVGVPSRQPQPQIDAKTYVASLWNGPGDLIASDVLGRDTERQC